VKFAYPFWLFGALFALALAALFVAGGFAFVRARKRFGDAERVLDLVTDRPSRARAWKAVLVVLATALAFVALARPQYGRGTRLIPATNLDVVIVLDFSKSMYARDVAPSRIARAKAEVARLIRDLPGARFGAVAFAGEPIAFPLTSDGAAIAQFFRQLEPNDMPVGGTAVARALERARELLARDPKSQGHSRVVFLVTDGEDLEGDPVGVARAAGQDGTVVDVVQIGGRTPERIPEIGPAGQVTGFRRDESGQPLTTALSAEGETQLGQIASVSGGQIVRSEKGATGIDVVARELKRKMTEELAERVETVYADVYAYPLAVALLLLAIEVFVPEGRRKKRPGAAAAAAVVIMIVGVAGCGWDIRRPFDRDAPTVNAALAAIDAGHADKATSLLEEYLGVGTCGDGGLAANGRSRERPNASVDLGIALFQVAEHYGQRFGDEEKGAADHQKGPSPEEQQVASLRSDRVECALRMVLPIAVEPSVPIDLRARAHFLAGNLEFLRRNYEEAVRHYDEALKLVPGIVDGGDRVGQDAAFNRAIALARIEEEKKKDAGADSGQQSDASSSPDGGPKDQPDAGGQKDSGKKNDDQKDAGDKGQKDSGQKNEDHKDAAPPPEPDQKDAGVQPPPPPNQDERMLDLLETAPTFQQQDAKNRAAGRKIRGMADK
jgi:Ca-activated chloride channel homolog